VPSDALTDAVTESAIALNARTIFFILWSSLSF
jgi:hypothetical protein